MIPTLAAPKCFLSAHEEIKDSWAEAECRCEFDGQSREESYQIFRQEAFQLLAPMSPEDIETELDCSGYSVGNFLSELDELKNSARLP